MSRVFIVSSLVFFWGALFVTQNYQQMEMQQSLLDSQWRHVEYQYQRCAEFLPFLLDVLAPHLEEEQGCLEDLSAAVIGFRRAQTPEQRYLAVRNLEAQLDLFYASLLDHPRLRSDEEAFCTLEELRLAKQDADAECRRFDEQSRAYNDLLRGAPSCYIAAFFGFDERQTIGAKMSLCLR